MKSLQPLVSTRAVLLRAHFACAALLVAQVALAAPPPFGSTTTPGTSLLGTPAPTTPEVQALIAEGQAAFQRGDLEKAKATFVLAYSMDTRNTVVIGFLRRIKSEQQTRPKYVDREKQLSSVILPKLQFREATVGSALDFLKKAVDKQTGGQQAVSFVVQLPAEQVDKQTVTLNLTNIPFTEALRYVGELVNADIVYEKYAILVKPKPGTVFQAAQPAP